MDLGQLLTTLLNIIPNTGLAFRTAVNLCAAFRPSDLCDSGRACSVRAFRADLLTEAVMLEIAVKIIGGRGLKRQGIRVRIIRNAAARLVCHHCNNNEAFHLMCRHI